MVENATLANMGFSFLNKASGVVGDYMVNGTRLRMQAAARSHRNTMVRYAAAQSQNTITLNENNALAEAADADLAIQRSALEQQGSADVAAGAAGVAGNSVVAVSRNLAADAARANKARLDRLTSQMTAFGQQRKNVQMSAVYNQDVAVDPKQSPFALAAGLWGALKGSVEEYAGEGKFGEFMSQVLNRGGGATPPIVPQQRNSTLFGDHIRNGRAVIVN